MQIKRRSEGFLQNKNEYSRKDLYPCIRGYFLSEHKSHRKNFFHFYPGTKALTIGTWSCNFLCPWCQNYNISKKAENIGKGEFISPEKFIEIMNKYKCDGTSISFNEPTPLFEYSTSVFKLAKKKNYYNTFVSNGYMPEEALNILIDSGLDAINFDIKGNKEFVKRYCGVDMSKIWKNIKIAKKKGIWVEIITLVIEGYNDREEDIKEIAKRIRDEIGEEVP